MTPAPTSVRPSLADLNLMFRSSREDSNFVIDVEYRVGKYGLRIARTGYASRGFGGKLRHLVVAHVIREVKPGYNWQAFCGEQVRRREAESIERYEARKAKQIESHGKHGHYCQQPKAGEVIACRQVCVDQNAVGRGAFDGSDVDTSAIDCSNCAVRFFHETVVPRAKTDAIAKVLRAEAKRANPPPTCPHCGDIRPRTKATERGERPLCSTCNDLKNDQTRYAYAAIHGKDARDGYEIDKGRAAQLRDEAKAKLDRREGRYSR